MASVTTTKSTFTISIGADQTYNLIGSDDNVTLASNDILGLFGSGNHIIATGAGDSVWMGSNGQLATGAAIDTINFYQGGYLYEMGSSNVTLVGSHVNVTVNDWDTLTASGSALHFTASGPGEIISIGGNGVYASDGNDEIGTFATGGTLNVFAHSRVDVTGSNVKATLAGDDTLGLYGAGETVTSTGTRNYVWIGQNGQNATGANIDNVTLAQGGTMFVLAHSNINVSGSHLAITLTSNDTLTLDPNYFVGDAISVVATGANDVVNVNYGLFNAGANGNAVTFQQGGALNLGYNASVVAVGDGVTANIGLANPGGFTGNSALTLTGSGNTINFTGLDYVLFGGNGQNATAARTDVINGVARNTVVLANSTVTVNPIAGNAVTGEVILNGADTLNLNAAGVTVRAFGGGDIVNLASNGQNASAIYNVYFETYSPSGPPVYTPGILNLKSNSSVVMDAANASVTLFSQDTLAIGGGAGNVVNIASSTSATNNVVNIGATPGVTTVNNLSPNYVTTGDVIIVGFGATGAVNASHTVIKAIDNATATVHGVADIVFSNPYISGGTYDYSGNTLTVGGNGATALSDNLAKADSVYLGDLDTLTVGNNATLILAPNSADATHAGYAAAVNLGANDYVSLTGTYALLAPAKTGSDVVTGFGGADTLTLTSTFANSAALLAATTYAAGNAMIHLGNAGDTISLAGVGAAAFAGDVDAGLIKI